MVLENLKLSRKREIEVALKILMIEGFILTPVAAKYSMKVIICNQIFSQMIKFTITPMIRIRIIRIIRITPNI